MEKEAANRIIVVDPERCTGCFRCALMCSFRFEKGFNPGYARIRIVPAYRSAATGQVEITFTDDCDGCGVCVEACPWGVLARDKSEKAGKDMDIQKQPQL